MKGLTIQAIEPKTLLQILQDNRIDWMHACGGKGRCTTCKVIIKASEETLPPLSGAEQKMKDRGRLRENERQACQFCPTSFIEIAVPKLYQLPHIAYTEE